MTNVMHKLLFVYLFISAFRVLGFLLAHLQRQVYYFGSGSSLLTVVSAFGLAEALTPYPGGLNHCRSCTPAYEDGLKELPRLVKQK
jgi:hypothetical protein